MHHLLQSTTSKPYWSLASDAEGEALKFALSDSDTTHVVLTRDLPLNDGEWHHIVLSINRGRHARIYIDGQEEQIGNSDISKVKGGLKHTLTIGGPHWYFDGVMDEFYLFQGVHGQELVDHLYSLD